MWHLVDLVRTDVSEERVASIFRVEKSARESLTVFFALLKVRYFTLAVSEVVPVLN
jgi:hypothetical protein